MKQHDEAMTLARRLKVIAMSVPDDGTTMVSIEMTLSQTRTLIQVFDELDARRLEAEARQATLVELRDTVTAAVADHAVHKQRSEKIHERWVMTIFCFGLALQVWAAGSVIIEGLLR